MSTVSLICKYYRGAQLQRLITRQHVWMSLTRVVDRSTIGVAVTAQSTVPTTTPTAPLAEPLDVHLVPGGGGGGVDQVACPNIISRVGNC